MARRLLTTAQRDALIAYAAEKGFPWKRELSIDWEHARATVGGETSAELQQVRNIFGPSWLHRMTLKQIKSAPTSDGGGGGANFVLSTGRRAHTRAAAHRASRTRRHFGARVNMVGSMAQRDIDALWRIGTDNDRDWLRRNGMLPSWEKKKSANRAKVHWSAARGDRAGGNHHRENENGLTFSQWLDAAGGSAHVESVAPGAAFKAWRAGEDPSDYRATRNRAGRSS